MEWEGGGEGTDPPSESITEASERQRRSEEEDARRQLERRIREGKEGPADFRSRPKGPTESPEGVSGEDNPPQGPEVRPLPPVQTSELVPGLGSKTGLNRKQRRVIWGAIALLFLALLIPPWQRGANSPSSYFAGYAFLFSTESHYEEPAFFVERERDLSICVSVLLVEALFITLAAIGAVVALRESTADETSRRQSVAERS